MEGFEGFIIYAIGRFILFLIIAGAVKMDVKEALYEFKEDVINEINLIKANEDNRNER
ncbi:hypothetical protein [Sedimentibacter sp. B4]|uniref:hypothetical protein n=1 Tax=Sedimentibacter sp. B4 TaxID=304766 RepID=UPI0002EF3047|nr:hypothetical protein [Sedimentibacter sp. B4]